MPAANRAILADIANQNLDPKQSHSNVGKNGKFVKVEKNKVEVNQTTSLQETLPLPIEQSVSFADVEPSLPEVQQDTQQKELEEVPLFSSLESSTIEVKEEVIKAAEAQDTTLQKDMRNNKKLKKSSL